LGIHIPFCHPALDAGSSPDWIPVFTGMTRELDSRLRGNDKKKRGNATPSRHPQPKAPPSSSTESEALRIGDPFGLDSRLRGNDTRGAGMAEQAGLAQEGWEWRTGQLISDKDYL